MSFPYRHIHVVGASGSGTTTLASALALAIGSAHLDTDDVYWLATSPPFREKRPIPERLRMLRQALQRHDRWVLSGSLFTWGGELAALFDLVVFLYVPPDVRLARSLARERQRYGERIEPGGDMHESTQAFLAWSATYDPVQTRGRNLASHRAWLDTLPCPVLEIAGTASVEENLARVLACR